MRLDSTPLLPDPDAARELLERELSNSAYTEAKPTWFDQLVADILQAVNDFFNQSPSAGGSLFALTIVGIVLVVVIVLAVVIWGAPRLRQSSGVDAMALFDEDDGRSAAQLRQDAEAAAAAADWNEATVLRLRALARGLRERGAVTTGPGATVHAFAREATRAFPQHATDLRTAATDFDDVRYLRRPGTEASYARVRELDLTIERQRPAMLAEVETV